MATTSESLNAAGGVDAPRALSFTILVRGFDGGGAQRDAVLLAGGLADLGCETTILTLQPEGPLRDLVGRGVKIESAGVRQLRSALAAFRGYFAARGPGHVVMSSEAAQNVVAAFAHASLPSARRCRLLLREVASPSIARRTDPYRQNRLAYRVAPLAYRLADRVVTLTHGAAEDLVTGFRIPREQIAVMSSNAVLDAKTIGRLDAFDGEQGREAGLIAMIGRLSPEKDHAAAIEAMALLPRSVGARLVIVGEGELRPLLTQRIAALGLGDRVRLIGYDADPFKWLMQAELCLSTSQFEGLGNVIIEALACGTPVIATDCPFGPREILEGGRFGRLVPVGDSALIAEAISQTLGVTVDRQPLRSRSSHFTAAAAAQNLMNIASEL